MVVIMKPGFSKEQLDHAIQEMERCGVNVMISRGAETTILGAEGNAQSIDVEKMQSLPGVERVMRVSEPYKKANRKYHPDDTVVEIAPGVKVGGKRLLVAAGPCSVESEEQITAIARSAKDTGAQALRGGAFKPHTSPYAFQGMGYTGLDLLEKARMATGLPVVTEIMNTDDVDYFAEHVDVIQVGARNMQNFDLLKRLGRLTKPILLKRGLSSTIEEWLMSAEYIMAGGNENIILCERGIRTFERCTRNTLDLSVVPIIKRKSHLPIIIDPSHATGDWELVESMSLAAIAAGADGLIIEVHNNPECAWSDGAQSLKPDKFKTMIEKGRVIAEVVGRGM